MKSAVIVFPGSNCDRDLAVAIEAAIGAAPAMVWHKETSLPVNVDFVGVPGGFSYGDYLRCGAIAARAPIMRAVAAHAARGGLVLGVCNGWQVLIEAGLLPGALIRNHGIDFVCRDVALRVDGRDAPLLAHYEPGAIVRFPVAHHDGAFTAETDQLDRLEGDGRVAFRYVADGPRDVGNPNGSARDIAGVVSENRRVLGMMPHPERAADPALGSSDGVRLFQALAGGITIAA